VTKKIARGLPKRIAQLEDASESFEFDKEYTEPEVNEILCEYFEDHVFARRLLIEWGYLDRRQDGSHYWRLK